MLFRFIGEYTNGRDTVPASGVVFTGREPCEVTDADGIRRLLTNPEFERVEPLPSGDDAGEQLPVIKTTRRRKKGAE